MTLHDHLHRRHKRAAAAFPDPVAVANALPNPVAEAEPAADPAQTLVSIVYVTASKTFDGPVGGYTTLTAPVQSSSSPKADTTPTSKPTIKVEPSTKSAETTPSATSSATSAVKKSSSRTVAETTLKTSSGLPSSLLPTSSLATSIPLLAASSSLSHDSQSATGSSTASAASSTETASKSGGMNAGGKAGLAVGIVLLLGTVLALVLFCFKRRRDAVKKERLDDEKTEPFAGAGRAASTRTTATAPRLSLRPVTQFLPNLGEKRQSRGNALALTPASAAAQAPRQSPWERPMGGQDAARNNPFGNHAEVIDATNANGPPVVDDVSAGGEIVAAGAAIGLARGASKRGPNQLDFTRSGPFKGPPSPAGTEFSMSSEAASPHARTAPDGTAVAIAAAGGPPNSTVHRVQLDFKPSMDDELELQAGQLIRLLHEYDDGWVSLAPASRERQCGEEYANKTRRSVFDLIAQPKVSFLERVCQLVLSSLALNKTVLEVHLHQACAFPVNSLALWHLV